MAAGTIIWLVTRPTEVRVVTPHRGEAAQIIYASGVVEPQTWAKVTSLVRERIVELCGCEGEPVGKGDILARLDDSEARAVLAELDARRRTAEADLNRLSVLAERNVASQQALERARGELAGLEAQIAGQRARLQNYVLRAPTSGIVLRQDGEVGEIAESGTVLFWVGEPRPLLVSANVNEEDIPRVAVGQRALLRSDAFPGHVLEATLDSITPKGDPVTKTYRVRLRLPDDTPLMIGMSVDVNIIVSVSKQALLVPTLALREGAVLVVEDGVARRRQVETGIRGTRHVEITAGLDDRDRVISPYPDGIEDGDRVTVTSE